MDISYFEEELEKMGLMDMAKKIQQCYNLGRDILTYHYEVVEDEIVF